MPPGKVAVVWRGDRIARSEATAQNNRFHRIFAALAERGVAAEPAVYDEDFAEEVRDQLLGVAGVLVWVNPLQGGKTRHALDAMLRQVVDRGPWVSAHPDAILAMGTKEVIVRTRHLGWGSDARLYATPAEFVDKFPARLATAGALVLKQNRGNDGQGVWKAEILPDARVRVVEAAGEAPPQELPLPVFLDRWAPYFADGGVIVEQPFQPRIVDGMVRCYMAGAEVAGFAHQYPKGLLPPGHVRPHAEKRMFPPDAEPFAALRAKMEREWTGELLQAVGLDAAALPVIWDADFLFGPKTAAGTDTWVLCEINVSSVFAIPDEAAPALARVVARRFGQRC